MSFRIEGRRILVTGASSGIGHALALQLAAKGASLAIAARREPLLEELATQIEADGLPRPPVLVADLASRGEAAKLAERAVEALGGVDVLVNNAGGGVGGLQWMVGDRDEAREAFEVNLWSPLALTATLLPPMRDRDDGAIVNVTSTGQVMPVWGMGHYVATKAALAQATETLRLELEGSGVHVLEVIPGPTDTAIQGESRLVPGFDRLVARAPVGKPEDLARLTIRALEKRRKRLVYPRGLRLPYSLPGIYRLYIGAMARRLRAELDTDDSRVIRSGSMGDPAAREAREQWERSRGHT